MEKIIKEAKDLSMRIANSRVYKEYMRTRAIIHSNPEMLEAVNNIKRRHFELHSRGNNDELSFDEEKYLSQESYKIALNEDIKTYFECEQKLIEILSTVFDTIAGSCPLDIFID